MGERKEGTHQANHCRSTLSIVVVHIYSFILVLAFHRFFSACGTLTTLRKLSSLPFSSGQGFFSVRCPRNSPSIPTNNAKRSRCVAVLRAVACACRNYANGRENRCQQQCGWQPRLVPVGRDGRELAFAFHSRQRTCRRRPSLLARGAQFMPTSGSNFWVQSS